MQPRARSPHTGPIERVRVLLLALACMLALVSAAAAASGETPIEGDEGKTNRVRIEYGPAGSPQQAELAAMLKRFGVLERFQEIFSPFKLPIELTLKVQTCDGVSNAWYQRPVVTICYETIEDIHKNMPTQEMPAAGAFEGITATDAVFGQFFYTVAHEMGHAIFDLLDVPIFGRAEDAADAFAAYMIIELGKQDARRLILGAAYAYQEYMKLANVCVGMEAFADSHSAPMQRYFNLLCVAYGASPEMFAGLIEGGYLPKARSENCKMEFYEMNFAFQHTIAQHLDPVLAKQVLDKTWVPRPGNVPTPSGNMWFFVP